MCYESAATLWFWFAGNFSVDTSMCLQQGQGRVLPMVIYHAAEPPFQQPSLHPFPIRTILRRYLTRCPPSCVTSLSGVLSCQGVVAQTCHMAAADRHSHNRQCQRTQCSSSHPQTWKTLDPSPPLPVHRCPPALVQRRGQATALVCRHWTGGGRL